MLRDGPTGNGCVHALVVGDADGGQPAGDGRLDHGFDIVDAVGGERVHVRIDAQHRHGLLAHASSSSSQMGKNSVVHCSGARAMMRSN